MRNYELINLLGEAKATEKVKVHICLSLQELMNGEQIDNQICWVYGFSGGSKSRECVVRNIWGELIKSKQRNNSLSLNYKMFKVQNHSNGWLHILITTN